MVRLTKKRLFLPILGLILTFISFPQAWDAPLTAEKADEKFYHDFLDSLPDRRQQNKKTMENNFFRAVKKHIVVNDPTNGKKFVKNITTKDLTYRRISTESRYTRGIFKEMPYLKPTPYMWIVECGPYTLLLTYPVDPALYLVDENQAKVLIKRSDKAGHS